jgi:hypothetical protein
MMLCLSCRTSLQQVVSSNGTTEWQHTHAPLLFGGYDGHDVVPVPSVELTNVNIICDFCDVQNPRWALRFVDVTVVNIHPRTGQRLEQQMGEWWATCVACAVIVETGDVDELTDRVLDVWNRDGGDRERSRSFHRPVYEKLLTHGVRERVDLLGEMS